VLFRYLQVSQSYDAVTVAVIDVLRLIDMSDVIRNAVRISSHNRNLERHLGRLQSSKTISRASLEASRRTLFVSTLTSQGFFCNSLIKIRRAIYLRV